MANFITKTIKYKFRFKSMKRYVKEEYVNFLCGHLILKLKENDEDISINREINNKKFIFININERRKKDVSQFKNFMGLYER